MTNAPSTCSSSPRHQSQAPRRAATCPERASGSRRVERLAEVLDERAVPAAHLVGVRFHPAQVLHGRGRQLAVRLEHLLPAHEVGRRVEQHALGVEAVASGAACLLLVVLDRLGRARVDHEPHVRPIDAHAERHGRDDDVGTFVEKRLLVARPLLVGEAGVVRERAVALGDERPGHGVDFLARQAVDDAGLPRARLQHGIDLRVELRALPHPVDQVGPIEVADQHEGIAESELFDDVVAHAWRGRGRECVDGDIGKRGAQGAQQAVLGPEVVAPVADAVRFVDGDEPDAPAHELTLEALAVLAHQPLGRHVEQPEPRLAQPVHRRLPLRRGHRAVEPRRGDAAGDEAIDLVLHQRNQRRHDQRDAVPAVIEQGRRLEAQRLAAARGQDQQAVAAIDHGLDRLALERAELVEAPVLLQDVIERHRVHGPAMIGRSARQSLPECLCRRKSLRE